MADGEADLNVKMGDKVVTAHVTVKAFGTADPISFKTETLAALTKAGCNMGACHGSPSGKGGFRLSLRGYDPPLDILTLKSEAYGRRTNPMQPDESLLLKKPLMQVAHGGGQKLFKGDPAHVACGPGLRKACDWTRPKSPICCRSSCSPTSASSSPPERGSRPL